MNLDEYQNIVPNIKSEGLVWLTPNTHVAWRVESIRTKEPDTFAWIEKMPAGSILFDVGANIGQYSMLAAKKGVTVHAFEPEGQNFALMVRNFAVNELQNCSAWPFALSDGTDVSYLHLSSVLAGGSCHAFGESKNFRGEQHQFPAKQGSISISMDQFAMTYEFGFPDYVKIDVDGFEHKVIDGADACLKRAKSVLIEINTQYPAHMELVNLMCNHYGFDYDAVQAEESRRKEGPFKGVGNIIFYKR